VDGTASEAEFAFTLTIERIFATNAALTNQVVEVGTREVILAQTIHGLLRCGAAIVAAGN
jgi:hypothetical protein